MIPNTRNQEKWIRMSMPRMRATRMEPLTQIRIEAILSKDMTTGKGDPERRVTGRAPGATHRRRDRREPIH
ncbi:MAG: hypothetical protein NVSMB8_00540 [Candidatus Limnocylindrales bacterium]